MQFREKANTVALFRTDEAGGNPVVIGKLSRAKLQLTDEIRGKLTAEEIAEVEKYIGAKGDDHAIDRQYAALHFAETLERVSEWLSGASPEEAARFVEQTHRPMRKLRQQLVRAANTGDAAEVKADDEG